MKTLQYTYFREYFDQQMNRKLKELQRFSVDPQLNLKKSKKMTLNDIAQLLGYKSPSSLSMIAKGDRLPSKKILEQLFLYWKTPIEEQKSISALVKVESNLLKGKKVLADLNQIRKSNSRIEFSRISLDKLELIKDWYHFVIFDLIAVPTFADHSIQGFYRSLNKKVTPSQIKKALLNLEKLKFIEKINSTTASEQTIKYKRLTDTISTPEGTPSEALRTHHRGMIHRGLDAIDEQDVENRQLSGLTFQVKKEKVKDIKKEIQNFFSGIYEKFNDVSGEEIYQMNLQLFSHTPTRPNKPKRVNKEKK
jgi:uncharacterized protein (TIGR02147 family)